MHSQGGAISSSTLLVLAVAVCGSCGHAGPIKLVGGADNAELVSDVEPAVADGSRVGAESSDFAQENAEIGRQTELVETAETGAEHCPESMAGLCDGNMNGDLPGYAPDAPSISDGAATSSAELAGPNAEAASADPETEQEGVGGPDSSSAKETWQEPDVQADQTGASQDAKCSNQADCDDTNPCTADFCKDGKCNNICVVTCCIDSLACDDSNPCTIDKCVVEACGACVHTPVPGCK